MALQIISGVQQASTAAAGKIQIANDALVRLATNTTQALTASNVRKHPATANAWVNFNGTGTVAIRASYNVSSITDNGTGDYTVNFITAMDDANYCPVIACANNFGSTSATTIGIKGNDPTNLTTTGARIGVTNHGNGGAFDTSMVCFVAFR